MESTLKFCVAAPAFNGRGDGVSHAGNFKKGSRVLEKDNRRVIDTPLSNLVSSQATFGDDPSRGSRPVKFRLSKAQKATAKKSIASLVKELENPTFLTDQATLAVKLAFGEEPVTVKVKAEAVKDLVITLYGDGSNIDYGFNSGNRRFFAKLFAIVCLLELGPKGHPNYAQVLDSLLNAEFVERIYKDEKERLLHNVSCNEHDADCKAPLDEQDIMKLAIELDARGATPTEYRKAFKDGTGQKAFEIMWANTWVLPGIAQTILNDAGKLFPPLSKDKLRELRYSVERVDGTAKGAERPLKEREALAKDPETVRKFQKYVDNPKDGKPTPISNRKKIEDSYAKCKIDLVKGALEAVLENRVGPFVTDLNEKAAGINEAIAFAKAGIPIGPLLTWNEQPVTEEIFKAAMERLTVLEEAAAQQPKAKGKRSKTTS